MWNAAGKVVLLLALGLLASCQSVAPVVKVGLVAPFEGRDRDIGYDAIYSARLAVREINAAGGINGHRLALVALDDGGDEALARQAAATLARDPAVVAVVGHFGPQTGATESIYAEAGLPLVAAGAAPFTPVDPARLPTDFTDAYAAVTPFDEVAGPYAGPTYDAFNLLWQALAQAEQSAGRIDRATVRNALLGLEYDGLTGTVWQPRPQ